MTTFLTWLQLTVHFNPALEWIGCGIFIAAGFGFFYVIHKAGALV